MIDVSYIKSIAECERKSKIGRIPDPLEEVFRFLLCNIEIYWRCNKREMALKAVQEIAAIYTVHKRRVSGIDGKSK